MSLRGRGCLEVNPSPNPFFQATSRDIGVKPKEQIEWRVNGKVPPFAAKTHEIDGNFSFLYSRESDVIGSKIRKPTKEQPKLMTTTEFLKKKREMMLTMQGDNPTEDQEPAVPPKATAEEILEIYEHNPKTEDPRYTTASGEYGRKAPSYATLVIDRRAIPQGFSSSFNGVKPQNSSMTTALSRSTVHKSLDPQFI